MSFRTWFLHEWRQLRMVRRVGVAASVAVPYLLLAVMEVRTRGWLPGSEIRGYDVESVVRDASPFVLAGVWVVLTALAVGQAFAGSSASEWFVLSLPVRRGTVWRARSIAALSSVLVVGAISMAALVLLVAFVAGDAIEAMRRAAQVAVIGIPVTFAGAACVSVLVRQPMQGALAGLLLAVVPLGLGVALASAFPLSTWLTKFPLAMILPAPVLPAFALASWMAVSRGEPGGRGRAARAATISIAALAVGILGFVVAGPVSARIAADRSGDRFGLVASPATDRALVISGMHGPGVVVTLVDPSVPRTVRFVGTTTDGEGAWHPDGRRFVVLQNVSALGALREPRLSIRSGEDGHELRSARVPTHGTGMPLIDGLRWCGDSIVANDWDGAPLVLSPSADAMMPIGGLENREDSVSRILGCSVEGQVLVVRYDPEQLRTWNERLRESGDHTELPLVQLVSLWRARSEHDAWTVDPVGQVAMHPWRGARRLSPSGRFLMAQLREYGATTIRVRDLDSGDEYALEGVDLGSWGWLGDDRLVWAEDGAPGRPAAIVLWRPGDASASRFPVPGERSTHTAIEVSPDGRRVLVRSSFQAREADEEESARWVTETLAVFDPADASWNPLPAVSGAESGFVEARWASPDTVLLDGPWTEARFLPVPGPHAAD